MNINMNIMNIMNLVIVLLAYLVHEPPQFLVGHEEPQFYEQGSGTSG